MRPLAPSVFQELTKMGLFASTTANWRMWTGDQGMPAAQQPPVDHTPRAEARMRAFSELGLELGSRFINAASEKSLWGEAGEVDTGNQARRTVR